MTSFRIEKCRSCEAEIIWATTAKGKAMPVDAEPCPDGNVGLQPNADPREPPHAHMLTANAHRHMPDGMHPAGFTRHKSHFATCEFAAQHRKAR